MATSDHLRDTLAAAMNRMPGSWFRWLREAHLHAKDRHGFRARVVQSAARIARHRRLPVESFSPPGSEGITLAAGDSWMARILYWEGARGYEGVEADFWRRACERANNVLELGANMGYYTVIGAAANPEGRYRAVEPHPASAAIARKNLALNGLDHVEVIEAAVVGQQWTKTVELSVPTQDRRGLPSRAFVREGSEGVDCLVARETFRVDAVAIGSLLAGVDLLKIDIEGHEADVLEPIIDQLIDTRPVIFVEVRLASVPRLRRIIVDLVRGGYLAFAIGAESLHLVTLDELTSEERLPRYGSKDLILVDPMHAHLL